MQRFNKGFTLIELLIVIALIGILATLGLVGFQRATATQDLQSSTDKLITQIRTMQNISLTKSPGDSVDKVNMTLSSTSYQITTDKYATPVQAMSLNTLPSTVTMTAPTSLTFDPFVLSNNAKAMITLTSSVTNVSRRLIISQETGRIRLDTTGSANYLASEQ